MNYSKGFSQTAIAQTEIKAGDRVRINSEYCLKPINQALALNPEQVYTVKEDNGSRATLDDSLNTLPSTARRFKKSNLVLVDEPYVAESVEFQIEPSVEVESDAQSTIAYKPFVVDLGTEVENEEVQSFLEGLGYESGDDINIRCFPLKKFEADNESHRKLFPECAYFNKKENKWISTGKNCRIRNNRLEFLKTQTEAEKESLKEPTVIKSLPNPWKELKALQDKGFCPYIVVNPGGQSHHFINEARVIFWEHDDISKDEQIKLFNEMNKLWNSAGMTVETKSSIHCYIRLCHPLVKGKIKPTLMRLVKRLGADKNNVNPARVLRFPGYDHLTLEDNQVVRHPIKLVHRWNGNSVDWCEVDKTLPELEVYQPKVREQNFEHTQDSLVIDALNLIDPDIDHGKTIHSDGTELPDYQDVIMAVHNHNPDLLEDVIDWQNRALLNENLSRASMLPARWKTFTQGAGITVACVFKLAIINGFQYPANLSDELTNWVKDVVLRGKNTLPSAKYTPKKSLTEEDLEEFDADEFLSDKVKLEKAKDVWEESKLGLPDDLIKAIESKHSSIGTRRETLQSILCAAMTADLNGKYKVEVNPAENWYEPLNLWLILVGQQGTKKSPVLDPFINPLSELNSIYNEDYKVKKKAFNLDLLSYNLDKKDRIAAGEMPPEEPKCRLAFSGQSTLEKLIRNMESQQEIFQTGLLLYTDEAKTIFSALNKHNAGDDDSAIMLSMYSGREASKDTIGSGRHSVRNSTLSIITTTQPDVFLGICAKLSGSGEGFDERLLTPELTHSELKMISHKNRVRELNPLQDVVARYYDKFRDLPNNRLITIAPEAYDYQDYLESWWNEDIAGRGKAQGQTYRIAGVMACLNNPTNPIISTQILKSALSLVKFQLACKASIKANNGTNSVEGLVTKAGEVYKKAGKLTGKILKTSNRATFAKLNKAEMKNLLISVQKSYGGKLIEDSQGRYILSQV